MAHVLHTSPLTGALAVEACVGGALGVELRGVWFGGGEGGPKEPDGV